MPEKVKNKTIFSLLEVTLSIQKTLSTRYARSFWVKAEMNKLNLYPQSGHCYPELIEKKEGTLIAQVKAILWKDDYISINNNFLRILKEPLKNGINILLYAKIIFDPVHGLSLRILDIDPSYSLGELEREKQETIAKMKKEGLFDMNKGLGMSLLPKRIAIISADTSKGYSDFLEVIYGNSWGYRFFYMLFPTLLQGERAHLHRCWGQGGDGLGQTPHPGGGQIRCPGPADPERGEDPYQRQLPGGLLRIAR